MKSRKKHLDFELILVPFIDLLSVCICFLLITAVWMNLGSMNVKQAIGGQSLAETEKKPLLWVFLNDQGSYKIEIQESRRVPVQLQKAQFSGIPGQLEFSGLENLLKEIKKIEPDLRTALIQPAAHTNYEDIVSLMDFFKKSGLNDLGIVPL